MSLAVHCAFLGRKSAGVVVVAVGLLVAVLDGGLRAQETAGDRTTQRVQPAERWLFSHPSHLRWWTLPNFEAHPEQRRLVTGILCVFIESRSGNDSASWLPDVQARCAKLGLAFAYGMRHSHSSEEAIREPFDPKWQARTVNALKRSESPRLMLDMEPYYDAGRRFHNAQDAPWLAPATRVWRTLGDRTLYIYPLGPEFRHASLVARQARLGGTTVIALDHLTYDPYGHEPLGQYMFLRQQYHEANDILYAPGFYLVVLKDDAVMREAARFGRCWFYPRSSKGHPDDLPHFGTPEWTPRLLARQTKPTPKRP